MGMDDVSSDAIYLYKELLEAERTESGLTVSSSLRSEEASTSDGLRSALGGKRSADGKKVKRCHTYWIMAHPTNTRRLMRDWKLCHMREHLPEMVNLTFQFVDQ